MHASSHNERKYKFVSGDKLPRQTQNKADEAVHLKVAPNQPWLVRVLGAVSVEGGGKVWDRFSTRRAALILIRLAMAQGRAVSRDAIAAALWPDEFPDTTKPRLRQELARLRKALGPSEAIIEADRLTLRLNTKLTEIDLRKAEQLVLRSALEQDLEKKGYIIQVLAEYPDEFAPGFDEPWI